MHLVLQRLSGIISEFRHENTQKTDCTNPALAEMKTGITLREKERGRRGEGEMRRGMRREG